jgi:hypothetical protein
LWDKHFLDVFKPLKIKDFQHCKATAKPLQRKLQIPQILENQALERFLELFFAVLQCTAKTHPTDPPTPPDPTSLPKNLVFSIHFYITAKLQK